MASGKSLWLRFDKGSLSDIAIRPDKLVKLHNGAEIYVCKSSNGEYYASKYLDGPVVNLSSLVMKVANKGYWDYIRTQLEADLG